MWNIEKIVSKGDYEYAIVRDHPNRTNNDYVLLHRVIMENHLGRILNTNEVVHHVNGDKKDNRVGNLQVMEAKLHNRMHGKQQGKRFVKLRCPWCGIEFVREFRMTHLGKRVGKSTCCSRYCSGKLSRFIQLHGVTIEVERAISVNIVSAFTVHDNTEQTH